MPKTKVTSTTSTVENDDGSTRQVTQYRTTVPKDLAEAFNLDGATLEWEVKSGEAFRLSIVARDEDE